MLEVDRGVVGNLHRAAGSDEEVIVIGDAEAQHIPAVGIGG